jgi:anti-sigma factor RsiW
VKNEHILDILDEKAFGELSEAERNVIENHTAKCSACLQAYQSAKITSLLLKTSVTQNFEPSPFFHTRVMANLREKQTKISPLFAFARMWKASGTLVAMMITTVLVLIALTVFAPDYNKVAASDNDSADFVILDEKMPTKEPNNDQIFQMVYGAENNKAK